MAGASLTIVGGSLGRGAVYPGSGAGANAGNGRAFGGGVFFEGDNSITLAPPGATVETISGVIADQTSSGGTGANAGVGGLILDGLGTLDLAAANTFTGGVTIDAGTLELAKSTAAGSGKITFATAADATLEVEDGVYAPNSITGFAEGDAIKFGVNGSATLAAPASGGEIDLSLSGVDYVRLKTGATIGATINDFSAGDEVDFEAVKYASTDTVSFAGGVV
jgi:autotransporter-associated beta strand protein